MRCEVCGHKIHGTPIRALIEGAKLTVCSECSKHGEIIYEETAPKHTPARKPPAPLPVKKPSSKPTVDSATEIVEGYDLKIRQAREKLGLSHEELGKRINEKASVLRKIETGKMTPDNQLAVKLEHTLKIKLLVPVTEEKSLPQIPKVASHELTLGDLMQLNKKGTGEPAERKPS